MVTIVSMNGLVIVVKTGITVVRLTAILRVLVVLCLVVRLIVMVLSFEVLLFDFSVRLLVVGVMVDVLTDRLGVLRCDQSRMVSVKVHLRVGVFWLEVVIDLPLFVVLRHDLDMVSALSIDWLIMVVRCMVPGGVMRHFMVDAAVGITVVHRLAIVTMADRMDISDLVHRHLTVVSLNSVLVVVVMRCGVLMVLVVGLVGHRVVLRVRLVVPVDLLVVVMLALEWLPVQWLLHVVLCGRDCGNNGDSERSHLLDSFKRVFLLL